MTIETPPNPLLTAYETYLESTPLITRYLLTTQVVSYLVSWFLNLHYALATIPVFIIERFEIYRLLLSPLINSSLFNVLFAFLGFLQLGRRMEQSLGSLHFFYLCLLLTLSSNLLFLLLCLLLSIQDPVWMHRSSAGLWTIFFGIIAMECVKAPRDTKRQLFFFQVPTLYYPVALFALFSFLGASFSLGHAISIALGYAFGFYPNILDKLSLSVTRARAIEESIPLSREPGWISDNAILGSGAWNEEEASGMALPLFRPNAGSIDGNSTSSSQVERAIPTPSATSEGRTLGGGTRSRDARAARLAALDKSQVL